MSNEKSDSTSKPLKKERRAMYSKKVKEKFPKRLRAPRFTKKISMRYGENPGYPAAFYTEEGASGPTMADIEVLQQGTKGLGYINVGDMDLGLRLVKKLYDVFNHQNICAVIKHEMPSGVARAKSNLEAYVHAWESDPLANFGGVVVLSDTVDDKIAELLIEKNRNAEVVFAPRYTDFALKILAEREVLRVVKMPDLNEVPQDNGLEYKRLLGGMLVQKRFDSKIVGPGFFHYECVSERKPTSYEIEAAAFNWIVACYTRSNAIVIGSDVQTHGIGSGQRARIDAAENAIYFANGRDGKVRVPLLARDTVMASDAFMPFEDVVELAAQNRITAIIYPLGSIRDRKVIDKANESNIAMLATKKPGETDSERCFLHR